MEGKQRLYCALGQLIYCVALADNVIQEEEEIDKVHSLIEKLSEEVISNFDIAEIVLLLERRQKVSTENAYRSALEEIKLCKHYFDQQLKVDYLYILNGVAEEFNGIEDDEESLIARIKDDIQQILIKSAR
jgi:hypothetical protein